MPDRVTQIIQAMIAPAVMLSACGLILLTLTNRLGRIVDRIRRLEEELRGKPPGPRAESIRGQVGSLRQRARLARGATALLLIAVACFVLTSLLLGATMARPDLSGAPALLFFLAGMTSILLAVTAFFFEVRISLRATFLEIDSTEGLG